MSRASVSPLVITLAALHACGSPVEPAWPQVADFELGTPVHTSHTFEAGERLALGDWILWAEDPRGEALTGEDLRRIPDAEVGWAWHDRHPDAVMPVPNGPAHAGWEAVAPDFTEAGYLQTSRGAYMVCLHVWITGAGPERLEAFGAAPEPDDTQPLP